MKNRMLWGYASLFPCCHGNGTTGVSSGTPKPHKLIMQLMNDNMPAVILVLSSAESYTNIQRDYCANFLGFAS